MHIALSGFSEKPPSPTPFDAAASLSDPNSSFKALGYESELSQSLPAGSIAVPQSDLPNARGTEAKIIVPSIKGEKEDRVSSLDNRQVLKAKTRHKPTATPRKSSHPEEEHNSKVFRPIGGKGAVKPAQPAFTSNVLAITKAEAGSLNGMVQRSLGSSRYDTAQDEPRHLYAANRIGLTDPPPSNLVPSTSEAYQDVQDPRRSHKPITNLLKPTKSSQAKLKPQPQVTFTEPRVPTYRRARSSGDPQQEKLTGS